MLECGGIGFRRRLGRADPGPGDSRCAEEEDEGNVDCELLGLHKERICALSSRRTRNTLRLCGAHLTDPGVITLL